MEKLFLQLMGRPFMAPEGEGANGGGGNSGNGAGSEGGQPAGDGKPSAADIAGRSGGVFGAGKGQPEAKGQAAAGDDGVDPASKPKSGAGAARPEHIPEKFWNADKGEARIDDIAKAYSKLEGEFARLRTEKGVPKDVPAAADGYLKEGVPLPEGTKLDRIGDVPKDDPLVNAFRETALKHKLAPEIAAGIASDILVAMNGLLPAPRSPDDILADLGDGGRALADGLMVWLEGQYRSGTLSEQELDYAFQNFGQDAIGIRLLGKLREQTGEKPIPLGAPVGEGLPSVEEWYAMHRDPRYSSDPAFREKVEALGEKVIGTQAAGESLPGVGLPPPRGVDRRERGATQR